MAPHYYTVEEANALLTTLRPLMAEMLGARDHILAVRAEVWPVLEKAAFNGGSKQASTVLTDFETIQRGVQQVQALGLELKDINTGLIDFLSHRDGREVYLCWRYNEPRVAHWHDLDAGFTGRQPL